MISDPPPPPRPFIQYAVFLVIMMVLFFVCFFLCALGNSWI